MQSGRARASNLWIRILTALVGVPLVLGVNYLGGWTLACFISIVAMIATWECARLVSQAGSRPLYTVNLPAATALAVLPFWLPSPQVAWIGIVMLSFGLIGSYYLLPGAFSPSNPIWVLSFLPVVYCGLLLGHLSLLRHVHRGSWWVVLLLLITWAFDTGAYFAGSFFGKRPFMQHVSSKKTVEGVCGGLVLSGAVGLVGVPGLGLAPWQGIGLGILGGAVAQLGDLIESMLKRQVGVKDSGNIIPGHGGLLDRIDGLLFTGALGYYASAALGYAS